MGLTEFLLVVAVGGGIIAVLYATFRGAAQEAEVEPRPASAGATRGPVDRELAELKERRRGVDRALEEIEVDREAGNLSESDFEEMRARYTREAAVLDERIVVERRAVREEGSSPQAASAVAASAGRRAGFPAWLGWSAGIVGFLALAWLVMSTALRPRGESDTITGSLPGQSMGAGAAGPAVTDVDMDRLRALEAMVAEDSSNVEALAELGHLYLELQRYGDVAAVSMKALEQDPDDPESLTHLGMVLMSVDHVEEGMDAFDRALAADPDFAEALLFKGMIAFRNQDFDVATRAWERYLEVAPPDAKRDRIRGMLEMARQNAGKGGSP